MHTLIYSKQGEWSPTSVTVADMPRVLEGYAKQIGLDTARFSKELAEGTYRQKVQDAATTAMEVGLPGTPTFFINGIYIPSEQFGVIGSLVEWFKWLDSEPMQFTAPDKVIDPAKKYTATIKLAKGDIVIELYANQTPNTVNSFVFLARKGYYDGVTFHRVLDGFVAQAGDPSGTGMGSPGYRCNDEIISDTLKFDGPGVIAMANSGSNTNGSQFFITFKALPDLDGRFSIFGRVISGLDVAQAITLRDPQTNPDAPPGDVIQSIVIEEK